MESTQNINPFKPGTGKLPPYLAGREDEQNLFKTLLGELSVGVSPSAPTVMYGPRGMGKTALLSWFKDEVGQSEVEGNPIRVEWITPNELHSPLDLRKSLLPTSSWFMEKLGNLKKFSGGVGLYGATANAGVELRESMVRGFAKTIIEKNKKRPLILLLDEAHKMDSGLCNDLLNVYQTVSKEMPLMLVLAGTPGLRNFLRTVGATFVERSEMVSLGRLDAQSAADAISKPFEDEGIEITNDALSIIVESSQCYPYFLQVWGSSLWEEAKKENVMCITDEQVEAVKPAVSIKKKRFYDERKDSIDVLKLKSTVSAIAQGFQNTKSMTKGMIEEIIEDNLLIDSSNTLSDVERLQTFIDIDFIWKEDKSLLYEPGIPSLMPHVLNIEKELRLNVESDISKEKLIEFNRSIEQSKIGNGSIKENEKYD